MRTFTNTKYTKDQLIEQVKSHYENDEIVKGKYWEDGKGCCVGCWVHSNDHSLFEDYFGIPAQIAHLADSIFEGLPNNEAKEFPLQLANAIPIDADLSLVWHKFAVWMLVDPDHGVIRFNDCDEIKKVAELHDAVIKGVEVSRKLWAAARDASDAAARAAGAAARDASDAAMAAAREAAREAADAAARAAWEAAGDAVAAQRDKLISLIKECA